MFFSYSFCFSQEEYTDLYITDTSIFNKKTIYIFNDNSWAYAEKISNINNYILKNDVEQLIKDTVKFFAFNWLTDQSHVKTYNLVNLKDSFLIDLLPLNHSHYHKPVDNSKLNITSTFKVRWDKWHKGIDIGLSNGNNIYSVFDGRVRYARFNSGGYGNLVIVRHYNGLETYYAHLDNINVIPGQIIKAGELIGKSGNTGRSTGPHLHFEVRIFGNAFNPFFIFNKKFELIINTIYISSRLFYHQHKKKAVNTKQISGRNINNNHKSNQKKRRNVNSSFGTFSD